MKLFCHEITSCGEAIAAMFSLQIQQLRAEVRRLEIGHVRNRLNNIQ